MSNKAWTWVVILVAVGVVIAILIGVLGQSQSAAERQYCDSLNSLQTSVSSLQSLDPSSASQGAVQSDLSAIQSAWQSVVSDAQSLQNVNMSSLDSAWDSFTASVQNLPSDSSASDAQQALSQSAQGLKTAVQSNLESYDCSSSS
jgi:hypothetical protein